jgi:methionyl aminopeptidase
MINFKTEQEVKVMGEGGHILANVLKKVLDAAKPGVSELELDRLAERLIIQQGAEPAFKRVKGYRYSICTSTNNIVVHGIPTEYKLKEGDVLGIDCGVFYKGFNTDMAQTVLVQSSIRQQADKVKSSKEVDKFLEVGKRALNEAIKVAKKGNRVGHISKKIQDIVEEGAYSVVRSLIGHGVGRILHEEPEVPGFLSESIEKTALLASGTTIAIEVIYNKGQKDVVYSNSDGWTISTKDHSLSGLFERTIAITEKGTLVLTK